MYAAGVIWSCGNVAIKREATEKNTWDVGDKPRNILQRGLSEIKSWKVEQKYVILV